MNSELLKLNSKDFIKGLVMVVFASVFTYIADQLNLPGFSFTALDLQQILNVGLIAGLTYLSKNIFSDTQGKFLGRIG